MLTVETRFAIDPASTKGLDTEELRGHFHAGGLFAEGEIRLIYSHYDRMIIGAAVPGTGTLTLDEVKQCGTKSILDRREMGVLNTGESGTVSAGGVTHTLAHGDVLYLSKESGAIEFSGAGRFYIVSTPAHAVHPTRLLTIDDAVRLNLGATETANDRTIFQFIHPDVMPSCQLVMGYTQLHGSSIWNSMPTHTHDRRMEAYLYFNIDPAQRIFHFMGEPQETRHIVMANEEAVISPPWSIHCGAGTSNYSFCWAMAGDNVDFRDIDPVALEELR